VTPETFSPTAKDGPVAIGDNPFPSSAVARLADREQLTIETKAVQEATAYLDEYLAQAKKDSADVHGSVMAIVGEYGTGKTHIALELLDRIDRADEEHIHSFYLDAPADTFLALYRDRFFKQLKREEVEERVAEYYADIVADDLGDSELTAGMADKLRSRQVEAQSLVRNLGLMETKFLQELQQRLRKVTEQDDFGTALSLFLRPEFQDAVWEWLRGAPPDPALVERGVRRTLDYDSAVLEAIGVFAFLYGRQRHRFVLVIDEMEKVLPRAGRTYPDPGTILAFKKLLEAIGKTRALLILSGLPDFVQSLPEDARQRISVTITPTPLTVEDTAAYIEQRQVHARGVKELKPFNRQVIAYLVRIAGGNARQILRLCYLAYERAAMEKTSELTAAMIRETAREQFEVVTKEDVTIELAHVIDSNGWAFEQDKVFGKGEETTHVDFWLPVGEDGSGCVVMITQSLLHPQEVAELVARLHLVNDTVRASSAQAEGLLVVNGYLAENLRGALQQAFGRIIEHSVRHFSEDAEAAIKGLRQRLEDRNRENVLAIMRERVEQLNRQNSLMRSSLEELLELTPRARVIEGAVERAVQSVFLQLGHGGRQRDTRFPRVSLVFQQLDNVVTLLRSPIDSAIDALFGGEGTRVRRRGRAELSHAGLPRVMRDPRILQSLAGVLLLEKASEAFRRSVFAEMGSAVEVVRPHRRPLGAVMEEIETVCRSFEVMIEGTRRTFQLDNIGEVLNVLQEELGRSPSGDEAVVRELDRFVQVAHSVLPAAEQDIEASAWLGR
jgi:type II secretory pathway predicted ATPase ExeA